MQVCIFSTYIHINVYVTILTAAVVDVKRFIVFAFKTSRHLKVLQRVTCITCRLMCVVCACVSAGGYLYVLVYEYASVYG